jgi:S-adenosylmethionine synthetase
MKDPVSIAINTQGTGQVNDAVLEKYIQQHIDLTPLGIIQRLDLRKPIYRPTAAYGHFGRTDLKLPWEALDLVDLFSKLA